MNVYRIPQISRGKWITLILIPFNCYVVIIVPFYLVFRILLNTSPIEIKTGENAYKCDPTIDMLLCGYMLCAPFLLLGAAFHIIAGNYKSAIQALFVAAVPTSVLILYLFIWVVQRLL
jgi:hypothetical protein